MCFFLSFGGKVGKSVCFFPIFCFSPLRHQYFPERYAHSSTSVRPFFCDSSFPLFFCDSLILCPSYGLRVSPHFIDSAGALPYPSPEFYSAWPIPIRQRPCHEQKSYCDQACIRLPMSLLALAAPAAWLFEQGRDFSLSSRWRKSLMNVDDTAVGEGCGWQVYGGAQIPGHWPWLRGSSERAHFPEAFSWNWADSSLCAEMVLSFRKAHELTIESQN